MKADTPERGARRSDPPQCLRVRRDITTPAGRVLRQPFEWQVGEQERREMVGGEGVLETVSRDVPPVPAAPDVIDQHMDPGKALEYVVS